jgi:hypothetical protein
MHDHSADNLSIILNGGYWEVLQHPKYAARARIETCKFRWPLVPYFRRAETPHRIVLPSDGKPVWSLWLRWPPRREWYFHCPQGLKHWKDYTASRDYSAPGSVSEVGPGCD